MSVVVMAALFCFCAVSVACCREQHVTLITSSQSAPHGLICTTLQPLVKLVNNKSIHTVHHVLSSLSVEDSGLHRVSVERGGVTLAGFRTTETRVQLCDRVMPLLPQKHLWLVTSDSQMYDVIAPVCWFLVHAVNLKLVEDCEV